MSPSKERGSGKLTPSCMGLASVQLQNQVPTYRFRHIPAFCIQPFKAKDLIHAACEQAPLAKHEVEHLPDPPIVDTLEIATKPFRDKCSCVRVLCK